MTTRVQLRSSDTPGDVPVKLIKGELQVNLPDRRLFVGDMDGSVIELINKIPSPFVIGSNTTAYPTLVLNGAAGTDRQIIGETAGVYRWVVVLGDRTPETGGNAGSNFDIARFADDGTYIDNPVQISRATGNLVASKGIHAFGDDYFGLSQVGTVRRMDWAGDGAGGPLYYQSFDTSTH